MTYRIFDFTKSIELTKTKTGYYCEDMVNADKYPNLEALGLSPETPNDTVH